MAEGVGFEPTEHCCSRVLQTRAFVHSAILPCGRIIPRAHESSSPRRALGGPRRAPPWFDLTASALMVHLLQITYGMAEVPPRPDARGIRGKPVGVRRCPATVATRALAPVGARIPASADMHLTLRGKGAGHNPKEKSPSPGRLQGRAFRFWHSEGGTRLCRTRSPRCSSPQLFC